jgi:hypothetical protein
MGIAFAGAMLLIYILVVWEFGSFKVPLIIISPIPLTMIGIMFGHWLWGAEFTATSMIGFIALAGIIVRNSILLVDFAQEKIVGGMDRREAFAMAGQARMRPIVITALALMGGSTVILTDPIFQGMAISLFFGVLIATLLTLIVIPMGCDSWGEMLCETKDGDSRVDKFGSEYPITEENQMASDTRAESAQPLASIIARQKENDSASTTDITSKTEKPKPPTPASKAVSKDAVKVTKKTAKKTNKKKVTKKPTPAKKSPSQTPVAKKVTRKVTKKPTVKKATVRKTGRTRKGIRLK